MERHAPASRGVKFARDEVETCAEENASESSVHHRLDSLAQGIPYQILRFDTSVMDAAARTPSLRSKPKSLIISTILSILFAVMVPRTLTENYKTAMIGAPIKKLVFREFHTVSDKFARLSPTLTKAISDRQGRLEVLAAKFAAQSLMPPSTLEEQEVPDALPEWIARPPVVPLAVIRKRASIPPERFENAKDDHCYCLVLPGGGTKGAFQSGAVLGLAEQYQAQGKTLRWDVVAGVSVGSFLSLMSLGFEPGQGNEIDLGRFFYNVWETLKQEYFNSCSSPLLSPQNIVNWVQLLSDAARGGRVLTHFCRLDGLGEYMRRCMHEIFDDKSGSNRMSVISATRLLGGSYTWNSKDWGRGNETLRDIRINRVLSSCSVPGAFPPTLTNPFDDSTDQEWFVDGGVIANTNAQEAVSACAERTGHDYSKIIVDIVGSDPENLGHFDAAGESLPGLLVRGALVGFMSKNGIEALVDAKARFPEIIIRHTVLPSEDPPINILDVEATRVMLPWGRATGWMAKDVHELEEASVTSKRNVNTWSI